jgi:signal transduction histidine kinase
MGLKRKLILITLCAFFLSGGLNYAIQRLLIMPSFYELEREESGKSIERVLETLNRELELISMLVSDWAYWNDLYRYAAGQNPEFATENLGVKYMQNLNIHLMQLYNPQGSIIWSCIIDSASSAILTLPDLSMTQLPTDHPFRLPPDLTSNIVGLMATSKGAMLLSVKHILTSDRTGPSQGVLIIGRFFDQKGITRIAEQARSSLTIDASLANITPRQWVLAPGQFFRHSALNFVETAKAIQAKTIIADIVGQPLLTLQTSMPRAIKERGENAVHLALFSIIGAGFLVMGFLLFLFHYTLLRPIYILTQHAIRIGRQDDLQTRLAFKRQDELGILAQEFDKMTDILADTRRKLIEQSYLSGLAEMASGVLHNIGNAITPLKVSLATLSNELAASPAAEMKMALSELAEPSTPNERRPDLAQFVELAGGELAEMVNRTQSQLASINQNVVYVQQILTNQEQYSRVAKIEEAVNIETLMNEAYELLAPTLKAAMTLDLKPDVRQLSDVLGSRLALLQLFNNLMINAAESIIFCGRKDGGLVVGGSPEWRDGKAMLHLSLTDNGAGIAPENLQKIFERGFSTKRRGSGIGLHWCANTINALPGRLYAESAGVGQGACFHLIVPLAKDVGNSIGVKGTNNNG